jgi:hypothetical protein
VVANARSPTIPKKESKVSKGSDPATCLSTHVELADI